MITKEIGKITEVRFGFGRYNDAMFGVSFCLASSDGGWGVQSFNGTWSFPPSENAKWTVEAQTALWGEMIRYLVDLMIQAKVLEISKLKGIPVEATFEDRVLKSFRILTEVL